MNLNRYPLKLVHDAGETPVQCNTVLIIDDQSTGRMILSEIVRSIDKKLDVVTFGDPLEAIEYAQSRPVDLVLTDYKMPTLDGIETIRRLRRIFRDEDVPIVCVTIVNDREIRYAALEAGATDFLTRPIDRFECRARCKNLITLRRHQLLEKSRSRVLEERVDEALQETWLREVNTLNHLAKNAEQRVRGTDMHLTRTAKYSALIAREHGLPVHQQNIIELVAPLRDIGQFGIPDQILQFNGLLASQQAEQVQTHPTVGYNLLKDSSSKYIKTAALIALNHHERFDGRGYPNNLSGKNIPLEARIVAIADVYDALTSVRPHRAAWPAEEAFAYIKREKDCHFDGQLADIFLANKDEIHTIGERFSDNFD
ncbi:MAG: HD domain-containing phosphohydrolase [Pseudomonadota bacterium]